MHLSAVWVTVALYGLVGGDGLPPPTNAAPAVPAPYPASPEQPSNPAAGSAAPDTAAPPSSGVVSGTTPAAVLDATLGASTRSTQATNPRLVWGVLDVKAFPDAGRMAPNGEPYSPLFTLDGTINVWLWPAARVYAFVDSRFWGERGTPGQTHGNFDFTKREFDLTGGVAWNYFGFLELRVFGYSFNSLNRGISPVIPEGYNDGLGIENRLYLSSEYVGLGEDGFNVSRATFVSLGYYPSKTMTGVNGLPFTPGLFAHGYGTWDISPRCYLYGDVQLICAQSLVQPMQLLSDIGLALLPFENLRMVEFRLGSEFQTEIGGAVRNNSLPYLSIRVNY